MKTVSISREEEGYWFAHEAFGNPARQGAEPGLRGLPPGPGTGHQGSNPEEARDGGGGVYGARHSHSSAFMGLEQVGLSCVHQLQAEGTCQPPASCWDHHVCTLRC